MIFYIKKSNQEIKEVINEQKMQTECYYRRHSRTFTKVLGADKDKAHRDQTLEDTGGNSNKDAIDLNLTLCAFADGLI